MKEGYTFDIAFTSVLKRAIKTLGIIQDEMNLDWIPVIRHWRLNERHYGALQGLNKSETAAKHGEEQVCCLFAPPLLLIFFSVELRIIFLSQSVFKVNAFSAHSIKGSHLASCV